MTTFVSRLTKIIISVDPSAWVFSGVALMVALELYHLNHQQFRIDDAPTFFRRAISLSPRKVGPRVGLSLSLSTLDRTEEALEQIKIAQRLHPADAQSYAIRRLVERRHLELASGLAIRPPASENEPR
jgi:hypothetical protein